MVQWKWSPLFANDDHIKHHSHMLLSWNQWHGIFFLIQMAHETENWIINCFLYCSVTSKSILDLAIDLEESHHNDFLRLVRPIIFLCAQAKSITVIKLKVQITFNATFFCLAGAYWRISWTICKNKDIFFYRCCQMGCRVLCEGGWWCSCQSR